MQNSADDKAYRFGPFLFDATRGALWRADELIPLTRKTAEILAALITHRSRIVDKNELLSLVWPNTVVDENNLPRHISTLRKVLDDRRGRHDYIVTIPGRGYRFVAVVEEVAARPFNGTVAEVLPTVGEAAEEGVDIAGVGRDVQHEAAVNLDPASRLSSRAWIGMAAAAAVLLVASTFAATFLMLDRSASRAQPSPALTQLTFDAGLQREPAWSPDGRWIAHTSDRAGNADIWISASDGSSRTQLTSSPARESQPAWSPDGRWIAFRSEEHGGGLFVIPSTGGPSRRLAAFGHQPRWSPDGTRLMFAGSGLTGLRREIFTVSLDGDSPRPLRPDLTEKYRRTHASWHPRAQRVSIWGRDKQGQWTFVTAPIDGGPDVISTPSAAVEQKMRESGVTPGRFVWSPSGRHIYFEGRAGSGQHVWRITVDPRSLAWIAGPDRLTSGAGDFGGIAISRDGSRLALTLDSSRTRLWAFPFDTAAGRLTGNGWPVTSGGSGEYDAAAPDDGTKVAYRTTRGNQQEVWERSVGDHRERLLATSSEWRASSPRWSRDGTRLAYAQTPLSSASANVQPAVAILTNDGGQRVLHRPMMIVPDDWSADGEWILGACRYASGALMGTCLMPTSPSAGADAVRVIASHPSRDLLCQRFSPDGRWISFMAVDPARPSVSTIYVMPSGGGPWTAITNGLAYDDKPRWSADGRTVYYLSGTSDVVNLWGRRFSAATGSAEGAPFQVTTFDSARQMIASELGKVEIAVSKSHLFLPITESTSELWLLSAVDR